jgi:hypothetical protein
LYYAGVLLRRAHTAMVQLNEFTATELANEPKGDIISSDSIFAGVFTLLSNLLTVPNATCLGFSNMDSIVSCKFFNSIFALLRRFSFVFYLSAYTLIYFTH